MANRRWYELIETQGAKHTYLPVTIKPQGSSTPLLGEGDANGSYFTLTRTSAGILSLATKDAFLAIVGIRAEATVGYRVKPGRPVQAADNTWSVALYTATDSSSVATVSVGAGGSGYTTAPTVAINAANGIVGFTATATVSAGAVTAITVTNPGFGATSAPTLTLSGGGGSAATATTTLASGAAGDIPAITATAGGVLYCNLVMRNSSVTP